MAGKIVDISSNVIKVEFLNEQLPKIGTILKTKTGTFLSVESIFDKKTIISIVVMKNSSLSISEQVVSTKKMIQVPVGEEILGRIFNILGEPIDGKTVSSKMKYENAVVYKKIVKGFIQKKRLLQTGIKALDFFIPMMEGDKIGMFGGAGVGKTLVIKEIINNITKSESSKKYSSIYVGIGERSREGEELYRELKDSNLLSDIALFFAQMNETPGARMKLIYSAITAAEHFRDVMKQDTLVFIDNIYRFTQAGAELSSALGNMPSQSGYQPTLMTEIANVEERLSNSKTGSITSFQTVFVPADDITDPATVNIFSYLDGSMVLDRKIASEGRYPSINPLVSTSSNLSIDKIGGRHLNAVIEVKKYLQRYDEVQDLLAILGLEGLSDEDKIVINRARKLTNFFTQDFFTAESLSQRKGKFVRIEDTIDGVERIMLGEFDKSEAIDFLYIGTVNDVKK